MGYAEVCDKLYVAKQLQPLQKRLASSSGKIRDLDIGEVFDLVEGPKEEHFDSVSRVRCRATCDAAVGWVTANALKPWSATLRCVTQVPMHRALAAKGAEMVRRLDTDEHLEFIEGPAEDPELGV